MAFAQLTYRESLRDIEACLRATQVKLYHMGIRGKVTKKRLNLERSLYQILQFLIVMLFKKVPIAQTLGSIDPQEKLFETANQLNLFN